MKLKKIIILPIAIIIFLALPNISLNFKLVLFYGTLVSCLGEFISYFFFKRQERKITASAGYSLYLLWLSFITKFFLIIVLFFIGFKVLNLDGKPMIFGFIIGQLMFFLNKLTTISKI